MYAILFYFCILFGEKKIASLLTSPQKKKKKFLGIKSRVEGFSHGYSGRMCPLINILFLYAGGVTPV